MGEQLLLMGEIDLIVTITVSMWVGMYAVLVRRSLGGTCSVLLIGS